MANKRANSKPIVRSAVYRPKEDSKSSKSNNKSSKDNSVSPKDVRKAKKKNTYSF